MKKVTITVLALIVCILISAGPGAAQDAPVISPQLAEQLAMIESITVDIRDLEELAPIPVEFPTRPQVVAHFEDIFQKHVSDDYAFRETQFYVALDLLPAGTDLRQVYLSFLTSPAGVAGYYDTDTQIMNVLLLSGDTPGDALPLLEQVTYSHEYVHALQDQHFDLDAYLTAADAAGSPDASLAALSLVEGDATLVMTVYLQMIAQGNPLTAFRLLAQGLRVGAFTLPEDTPPFIVAEQTFPYETGMTFVRALYRAGGWDTVNAAFANPPVSTEQIIHPQKYLSGEQPLPVALATTAPAGWTLVIDRPLGEFYLFSYLRTQLPMLPAASAAAGWGGDRFQIYRDPASGQLAWALRIEWDTRADSVEFNAAFADFAAARFEDGAREGDCWSNADQALCLLDDGGASLIVMGPSASVALGLLAAETVPQ